MNRLNSDFPYPNSWRNKFPWIKLVNESEVSCRFCDCWPISAQCSNLQRHSTSKTHLDNVKKAGPSDVIISSTNPSKVSVKRKQKVDDETLRKQHVSELKLCAMVASDDLAFLKAESVVSKVEKIFDDSEKARVVTLDRKKISAIIRNVIAPEQKKRLTPILRDSEFSILIDESTNCADFSSIAILVRYADEDRREIRETLWDIVPAHAGNEKTVEASGEYIARVTVETFEAAGINLLNIIAFLSDTCSVMMGCNKGVAAYLKKLIPEIKIIGCGCHVEHLLGQDCWQRVPEEVCDSLPAIPLYIRGSAKKSYRWILCQERFDKIPTLRVQKANVIRWLSQYGVLLRILRRLTASIYFFEFEVSEIPLYKQKLDSSEKNAVWILQQLKDSRIQLFMLF